MHSRPIATLMIAAMLLLAPVASEAQEVADHGPFTALLQQVVERPLVDYEKLVGHRQLLDRYVASLGRTNQQRLEAAPRSEQLAFWLNAYNACMLQLVADHYPIEKGGVGLGQRARNAAAGRPDNSVWWIRDVFDDAFCTVAGKRRSLDEIEHEIIRPVFGEPRIHFALNCGAFDCPELADEAYEGERLEEQLDRQVERFIGMSRHFRLVAGSPPALTLNKVLDWFSDDFGGTAGIPSFFAPYLPAADRAIILDSSLRISFSDYDWTLNDVHAVAAGK